MNSFHNVILFRVQLICEAPTGPMTATDKKILRNTTTACVEILADYIADGSWMYPEEESIFADTNG